MLANGSIPMLKSTTTSADSRHATAASAGDVLSHPNDRRNSAASGSADNNSSVGRGTDSKMNDFHQRDHDRGSSPSTVVSSKTGVASSAGGHAKRLLVSGGGLPKKGGNAESFNHWGPDVDNHDDRYHDDRYKYAVASTTGSRDRVLAATAGHHSSESLTAAERGAQSMGSKPPKDGATFSLPASASAASRDMEESASTRTGLNAANDVVVTKVAAALGRSQTAIDAVSGSFLGHEGNGTNHTRHSSSGEHLGQRAAHPLIHRNHHGEAGRIGMDVDDDCVEVPKAFPAAATGATAGLGEDHGWAKGKAREASHFGDASIAVTATSKKRKERDEEEEDEADGRGTGVYGAGIGMDRAVSAGSPRGDRANVEFQSAAFKSIVEDPPLGEGWDEEGNDLSKIANDAIRKAQCEAWTAKLRQEASAIRAGDHPEVVRRSVLTVEASKRRNQICEKYARRQRAIAERLYDMEVKSIHASYEAAMEQARERLMSEVNEEIRRSKSRLEGFREVENRMNTRHTRNNAKGTIEDPWLAQTTGSKTNGNSKRPLCPVSLVLEDEDLVEDIDFLRYSGHDRNNGGGGAGGGGVSGSSGGYNAYDMPPGGVSGRARRPPAWRRDD